MAIHSENSQQRYAKNFGRFPNTFFNPIRFNPPIQINIKLPTSNKQQHRHSFIIIKTTRQTKRNSLNTVTIIQHYQDINCPAR